MKPLVAIVGRPNVGKSTLFNRLVGRKRAIAADEPGVTRDLNYADCIELGRAFTLIDTGGFESRPESALTEQVRDQARLAVEEADVIVFLMDGRAGPAAGDAELVSILRRSGKPVVWAANKMDRPGREAALVDFYSLGIEPLLAVSAEHGHGVDELIDAVLEALPRAAGEDDEDEERVRVAIVGRPNVGKSSLLNRLIGRKRAIVSDVAGTTRDPVDTPHERGEKKYLFIDTAGIRRKNRVSLTVEGFCVVEAIKSIARCDVAVLVLDADAGVHGQDERIAGLIEQRKRGCVVVVNKWDLVVKETRSMDRYVEAVRRKMPFISYAPVVFTSALKGRRVENVIEGVDKVVETGSRRFATSVLNPVVEAIAARHAPPSYRGRAVKFYYVTQTGSAPPSFVIFTNYPEGLAESYRRYMVRSLRESLGLECVPVKVWFRRRS